MALSNAERQQRYRARKRGEGRLQLLLYVTSEQAERIRAYLHGGIVPVTSNARLPARPGVTSNGAVAPPPKLGRGRRRKKPEDPREAPVKARLRDIQRWTGKGYISELEHKKIDNPKPDKLKRLAAALGISELDIVSRRMPDEVKNGNVCGEEDVQGLALIELAGGETPGEMQPPPGQPTPKASTPRTVYHSPLPMPSHQKILIRRLAVMKKRLEEAEEMLEAAAKNLREAREEQRELAAFAEEMFNQE